MTPTTVLITGATSGLGLELARLYADGFTLILSGRKPLQDLDKTLFTEETYLRCDLARADAAATVTAWLAAHDVTQLDLLVHNAAVGWYGDPVRQSELSVEELLAVNLYAPILLTRALLPLLKGAGGKVVFVASVAADLGAPDYAVYGATKAALAGFARNLRLELGGEVGVLTFYPGAIRTPMHRKSGVPAGKFKVERFSSAEEVAKEVYRAAASKRHTVTSGLGNKALRAFGRFLPGVVDAAARRRG